LAGAQQQRETIRMTAFVDEIAATGMLHAEYRSIRLLSAVEPTLTVQADCAGRRIGKPAVGVVPNSAQPLCDYQTERGRAAGTDARRLQNASTNRVDLSAR
jgi:hypothetical protein